MIMSDDKTLLELAAKAAGYLETASVQDGYGFIALRVMDETGDWTGKDWNPLIDDGQALRLAVKLDLAVMPYPVFESPKHSVVVSQRNLEHSRFEVVELYKTDPYAATRRAIVRAAAAIGESM